MCQAHSTKLDDIAEKQDKLEALINEQNNKIDTILSKLEGRGDAFEGGKKVKDKGKSSKNEFYQVNIYFIFVLFMLSLL